MKPRLKGWWLIILSLLLVPLFQVLPLRPDLGEWRPFFPLLLIAFWAYIAPSNIGPYWGFIYGLLLEVVFHMPLMQLAVPCAFMILIVQFIFMKLRTYSIFQQAVYVGGIYFLLLVLSYPLSLQSLDFTKLQLVAQTSLGAFLIWLVLLVWLEPWCRRNVIIQE